MYKEIEIGKRIRLCREEAGITQEELGQTLGLNKSTIQRYETGKIVKIKLPILQAMANTLNVNPNYLALKTDNPQQNPSDDNISMMNNIDIKKRITLSSHELNVIEAYRNKPDMQPVVDKILDVNKEEKTYTRFVAARSENGQSPMRIEEASKEAHDDLANAPETDMDF